VTVFFSGPMGAGKTTVAQAFASRGARVLDLDRVIEARHGVSVAQIIRARGEAEFRTIERATAREIERAADVIALGGGTVTDRSLRRALLSTGTLITLTARPDVLAARVGSGADRPLLGSDPAASLARILDERADAYAECHATFDTEHVAPDVLVDRIRAVDRARPIVMPLGTRSYAIHVGRGVSSRIHEETTRLSPTHVVVVCDENTRAHASVVQQRLPARLPWT
jgi:shikimate kinase